MKNMNDRTTLMRTFTSAMSADLAISPMIIVEADGGNRPWIDAIEKIADALDMKRVCYVVMDDQVQDVGDWAWSGEEDDTGTRTIVLAMRREGGDPLALAAMLKAIHDYSVDDTIVVVVTDEDGLTSVCDTIGQTLSVPAILVPTCRQGFGTTETRVRIVGEATMVGRSNGKDFLEATVSEPYVHEVGINVECDAQDDRTLDGLMAFGENFRFAAMVQEKEGALVCRLEDIVAL